MAENKPKYQPDAKFAKALKSLANIKGIESLEFTAQDGTSVKIDDTNRSRIIGNCNAIIRKGKK